MNMKDHEIVQPLLSNRISQVVLDLSKGTKRSSKVSIYSRHN